MSLLACIQAQEPQPVLPQKEPTATIDGRVVDLRGEPVPLAEVWVTHWLDGDRKLAQAISDGEGFFRLARVPVRDFWSVRATAEGRSIGFDVVRTEEPAQLYLHDAATVRGILHNANTDPVAGVVIRAAEAGRVLNGADTYATTGADGAFILQHVPLGPALISAAVPGEGLYETRVIVANDMEVVLRRAEGPTTSIECTVEGLPAGLAPTVSVALHPNDQYSFLPPPWDRPLLSGDGKLSLRDLPDTDYAIDLRSPTHAFAPGKLKLAKGAGPHSLRFTAKEIGSSATMCRAVLRDANGQPLGGVRLALRAAPEFRRTEAETDDQGRALLSSHQPKDADVIVYSLDERWVLDQPKGNAPGHEVDRRDLTWHGWKVDPDVELELRATPACEVRGHLLHADGRHAAFVRVELQEASSGRQPHWMSFAWATANREGVFRFRRLHYLEDDLRVKVEGTAGSAYSEVFLLDKAGIRVVVPDPRLSASATIEGIVRDERGALVPGLRVWLRDWDFEQDRQRSGSVVEAITDRQGRYRFDGVPPGGAYLELLADFEERIPRERAVEPFDVKPGKTYEFDLKVPDR